MGGFGMKKEFIKKWITQENTGNYELAMKDLDKLLEVHETLIKDECNSLDNWISVEDELPEIGIPKDYRIAWIVFDGDIVTYATQHPRNWNKDGKKITHYQPRPQPPKDTK